MIYLSVCSGIEAATVAWHAIGWKPAAFSEIEAFPRSVLSHHYPDVPLHGDFTTIKENDYGTIELLVGGTPCQAFSVAGLRKGFADEHGNLTLEFIRLAQRLRPKWLVWENVPGVLSIDGGRAFGSFLGGLAECGYGFAYRILDAQYFGVPQRRRRVFVVGYLGDWRPPTAVLFERESLRRDITPSRHPWQEITPTIRAGAPNGGAGHGARSGDSKDELIVPVPSTGHTSHCLNAGGMGRQDYETETLIAHTLTRRYDSGSNGTESGTPIVSVAIPINTQLGLRGGETSNSSREGIGIGELGDPAFTLQSAHGHAVACFKGGQGSAAGSIGYDEHVSPTLNSADSGSNRTPALMTGMQVRRLTPRECERLQGFPDDYTLIVKGGGAHVC